MIKRVKTEEVEKSIVIPEGLSTRRDNNYLERLQPAMSQDIKQGHPPFEVPENTPVESHMTDTDHRGTLEFFMRNMGKHFPTDSEWHKEKALDIYDDIDDVEGVRMNRPEWGVSDGNENGKVLYWVLYNFDVLELNREVLHFLRHNRCKAQFQDLSQPEMDENVIALCEMRVYLVNASVEPHKGFGFGMVGEPIGE